MTIDTLINAIEATPDNRIDIDAVHRAFAMAEKAHRGQTRASGEPFVQHPLHVALQLAQFNLDTATIVAALLHDTLEDTDTSKQDIKKEFGPTVLRLVEGLTKLNKVEFRKDETQEYKLENLRKMFLAMAADVRVVLIKLADRYHNMLTLDALPEDRKRHIAQETLNIYAPLANRLSIGELRSKLEDLAFPIILPKEAEWTQNLFQEEMEKKRKVIETIKDDVKTILSEGGIEVVGIHGRIKGLYSLYEKLLRYDKDINKIYDLAAVRVIVQDIPTCYTALGLIHRAFKPLVGRIKDYISIPKPNGYRSIHTTVITPRGGIAEIQIRTPEMHQLAEFGVIADWAYSEEGKPTEGATPIGQRMEWVRQLAEWQKEIESSEEFEESLKIDVFKNRIFAFTPRGEVIDLPDGATAIDFAYAIHTSIGHQAEFAKIEKKKVPLETILKNGDVVEIILNKGRTEKPRHEWLSTVRTNPAKKAIREWFRKANRQKRIEDGQRILDDHIRRLKNVTFDQLPSGKRKKLLEVLHFSEAQDLFLAIGQGDIAPRTIIRRLFTSNEIIQPHKKGIQAFGIRIGKSKPEKRARIEEIHGFTKNLAKDCKPRFGHPIVSVISKNSKDKSVTIHDVDCKKIIRKDLQPGEQIVPAEWDEVELPILGEVIIEVNAVDRIGLLRDIADAVARSKHNITLFHANSSKGKVKKGILHLYIRVELHSLEELEDTLQVLLRVDSVLLARRIEKLPPL